MRIYRATTPTCFEMQNNELIKFIGSLNLPYESCVASDCGFGEAEHLFKKGTEWPYISEVGGLESPDIDRHTSVLAHESRCALCTQMIHRRGA